MTNENLETFIGLFSASLSDQSLQKLLLSKYRGTDKELQRLTIRPIELHEQAMLCFVYRYKTRDITKNLTSDEGLAAVKTLLGVDFKSAHLTTDSEQLQVDISKKGKVLMHRQALETNRSETTTTKPLQHNREKKRFVDISRPYLTALGVTDQQRQLIPAMSRKWKQINKFIEVFSQALGSSPLALDQPLQVVDFGSGKGYLTFAIHDYLCDHLHTESQVTGVELRESLADLCNRAATKLEHGGLDFVCGDVKTHAPNLTDVMIALHACDTATDYAIHYGIRAGASIIMCSPCCHKQLRPQMQSPEVMQPMLQYGVHMGQQAEMVTDSLRALLLQANGYTTKVFEFVSLEHTNKNKMILAVKQHSNNIEREKCMAQVAEIKAFYGVEEHCLEALLLGG